MLRKELSRRTVLRGLVHGSAVAVSVPLLDCLLNGAGTAYADGSALPVRFGTWSWGCGFTPQRWIPDAEGPDYDLKDELRFIEPFRKKVNILTGFDALLDGRPNTVHVSGTVSIRTGTAPEKRVRYESPTFDSLIADAIGSDTRFRSLELAPSGNQRDSYSYRAPGARNTPETSPAALYARVFGQGFQDPRAAEFTPDPTLLPRISVLSVVKEDRRRLESVVGTEDRRRLDEYFTSLRQVEKQLELQLKKPRYSEACVAPEVPVSTGTAEDSGRPGDEGSYEVSAMHENHQLMVKLLGLALACNQTHVFNIVFSNSASKLHNAGGISSHHLYTHEEATDPELGYQVMSAKFVEENMKAWADLLRILDSIPEGEGSVLDRTLILAHSDTSFAKIHSVQGIPMMTAGSAGGRIRTGLHVSSNGDTVTRVGLTLQQVMGLPVQSWGTGSMETSNPVAQILV